MSSPVSAIGLTGGIGSGKSTVAQLLVECGAHLVDTDAIARALTLPGGAAMPALAAAFGPQAVAIDGALDRARMRELAFADLTVKARLEAILHPLIGAEAQRLAAEAAQHQQVVVFDVPLLAPASPWRERVQRLLVIDCTEATQIARVGLRAGWSEDAARRVIAQQLLRGERLAMADAVIFNDGGLTLVQLAAEVRAVWAHWIEASDGR